MSLTTDVQKLYVAFFNRSADVSGLAYWIDQALMNGGDTANVANAFSASAEYNAIYSGLTSAQTINTIYMNLFGRPVEPGGLSFWDPLLESGTLTLANIAITIANGAQNDDKITVANKVTAATNFTNNLDTTTEIDAYSGDAANAVAIAWLNTITSASPVSSYSDPVILNAIIANLIHSGPVATPVYTVTPSASSVNEGLIATFSVGVKNVADGAILNYSFSGNGVDANDIAGGLTGSAIVSGGKASISMPTIADKVTEGAESAILMIVDSVTSLVVATSSITIDDTSANTVPVFPSASVGVDVKENTRAVYTAKASDAEGNAVSYALAGVDASAFTLDAGTGVVNFKAAPNYEVDSKIYHFDVLASDGTLSTTQEVSVNVIDVNEAPSIASGQTLALTESFDADAATTATGTIVAGDPDGDAITYGLSGGIVNGTTSTVATSKGMVALDTTTGKYTYTYTGGAGVKAGALAGGSTAGDTVTVVASDKLGLSSAFASITLTVTGVDNPPTLVSPAPAIVAATSGQGSGTGEVGSKALMIDLNAYATDVDTASDLMWVTVGQTTTKGGALSVSSAGIATVSYPQSGGSAACGADSFVMSVKDASNPAVIATVNINIGNAAPVAHDDSYSDVITGVVYTMSVTSNDSDADGNTLTPTLVLNSMSAGGHAEVIAGTTNILYTSLVGFFGTETFAYTISDGFNGTATGIVTAVVHSNVGFNNNDNLLGTASAEIIDGLTGNDTINGGGGLDTITGGDGNDRIIFNDGAAIMMGGADSDTLVINPDALAAVWDLSATLQQDIDANSKNALGNTPIVRGFENLDAGKASHAVSITAASTGSVITGSAQSDVIYLGAGFDKVKLLTPLANGLDFITGFASADDKILLLQGDSGWNAAGSVGTVDGSALGTNDYVTSRAVVTDVAAGDDMKVDALSRGQTSLQLQSDLGGAANAYVVVFNITTGHAEIWYDNDWSNTTDRTQVAVLSDITTLAGVTGLVFANFQEYI